MIALPPELLTKLEQATNRSDMEQIVRLIAEVRSHDVMLADALTHLSNMFDYDEILRLLHEAREERSGLPEII